jgi:hypothetical protein
LRCSPGAQRDVPNEIGKGGHRHPVCALTQQEGQTIGTPPLCVKFRQYLTSLWARPESLPPLKEARQIWDTRRLATGLPLRRASVGRQ